MGKDKAGGTGREDQPEGREKGQCWPGRASQQQEGGQGGSGVMSWGPTAPTLGTNSAEGEPACCKASLAGPPC